MSELLKVPTMAEYMAQGKQPEVLFWVGCAGSFDDRAKKITKAFERLADLDAKNIKVEVDGHKVKLKGKVHSYAEKDEARKTAFYAPGVYEVENELEVAY